MRVCVVAEYYPRRRDPVLGVWAYRQALAARDAGAEVRVLALERPLPSTAAVRGAARARVGPLARELRGFLRQPGREVRDGMEVRYVRFVSPQRDRAYARWHRWAGRPLARALSRLHREWPFDVVHAHYAHLAGAAALPWTRRAGVPLVLSVHGGDLLAPTLSSGDARGTITGVLRGSAVVMCNSRATLEAAAALAGSSDAMRVVYPPGTPAPEPAPARRPWAAIATLGHVIPRKRLPEVGSHEREWAFVDTVGRSPEEVEDALDRQQYETKTRGERIGTRDEERSSSFASFFRWSAEATTAS